MELDEPVKAIDNIEEWLVRLEAEMRRSVRTICAMGAVECLQMPLMEFVSKYQSQVALLGIQIIWTQKVTECLEQTMKNRSQAFD